MPASHEPNDELRDLSKLSYDQQRSILAAAMQRAVQVGDYEAVRYVSESIVALEAAETARNELAGRLTHLAQKHLILVPSAAEARRESKSRPAASKTNTTEVTLHHDGTVTYWSVYKNVWVSRVTDVPDRELAAMNETTRERVRKHLGER